MIVKDVVLMLQLNMHLQCSLVSHHQLVSLTNLSPFCCRDVRLTSLDDANTLSILGSLVAAQAERVLQFCQSPEARKSTKKTELTSTVQLETGTEFSFTFSVDPMGDL